MNHQPQPIVMEEFFTTTGQQRPLATVPMNINNAYYDKPADRRLRPWVFLGSLLTVIIGAGMIVTTFVGHGTAYSLWGVLAAGIALAVAGVLGMIVSLTLRPGLTGLFFFTFLLLWAGSIAVLIVNATMLNKYMNNRCNTLGAPRYSPSCENVREYHTIIYCVFGPLVAMFVPTVILSAGYLWRTTTIYRKQEADAAINQRNTLPVPVGSSRA